MADDIAAQARNEHKRKLLDVVRRYEHTYNTDVEKLVLEVYAHDVHLYMTGGEIHGKDQFLAVEKAILAAAPKRRMRVDRALICGPETVVIEAVILDDARPDFFSPFCVIFTIRDGKIVEDRSYLDPSQWPGIAAAAPLASPGGLGKPG
ncbi:MAG: nuclear transport factor 2 family protein [Panacagrimonas sp.]